MKTCSKTLTNGFVKSLAKPHKEKQQVVNMNGRINSFGRSEFDRFCAVLISRVWKSTSGKTTSLLKRTIARHTDPSVVTRTELYPHLASEYNVKIEAPARSAGCKLGKLSCAMIRKALHTERLITPRQSSSLCPERRTKYAFPVKPNAPGSTPSAFR